MFLQHPFLLHPPHRLLLSNIAVLRCPIMSLFQKAEESNAHAFRGHRPVALTTLHMQWFAAARS